MPVEGGEGKGPPADLEFQLPGRQVHVLEALDRGPHSRRAGLGEGDVAARHDPGRVIVEERCARERQPQRVVRVAIFVCPPSRRAAAHQHQPVTGSVVTSTLMGCAETLLDKRGGYISNDRFPPGLFMDNVPNWEFGVLTATRDLAREMRNKFSRSQSQCRLCSLSGSAAVSARLAG